MERFIVQGLRDRYNAVIEFEVLIEGFCITREVEGDRSSLQARLINTRNDPEQLPFIGQPIRALRIEDRLVQFEGEIRSITIHYAVGLTEYHIRAYGTNPPTYRTAHGNLGDLRADHAEAGAVVIVTMGQRRRIRVGELTDETTKRHDADGGDRPQADGGEYVGGVPGEDAVGRDSVGGSEPVLHRGADHRDGTVSGADRA